MNSSRRRRTVPLFTALLAGVGLAAAACGGGAGAAPVNAPPASPHTAAEKAAALNWLAKTNQMWTRHDYAALDQVTTGEMRTVYQSEEQQKTTSAGGDRKPLQLTGLYAPDLARALDHAATGTPETAAAAAPFAVNSFFSGPDSFSAQSATQIRQDRAGGITLTERFSPTADPTLTLPLAGGRGYWLISVLTQTATYSSAAGIRKDTLPDGASIAATRPTVVHHATDTYITTYTAIDPLRSAGGTVALDGFFGWPLTANAS